MTVRDIRKLREEIRDPNTRWVGTRRLVCEHLSQLRIDSPHEGNEERFRAFIIWLKGIGFGFDDVDVCVVKAWNDEIKRRDGIFAEQISTEVFERCRNDILCNDAAIVSSNKILGGKTKKNGDCQIMKTAVIVLIAFFLGFMAAYLFCGGTCRYKPIQYGERSIVLDVKTGLLYPFGTGGEPLRRDKK